MMVFMTEGHTSTLERVNIQVQPPWQTIVWDDPVNLMSYVTYVFMDYFKYSKQKSEQLMMQVHTEGKAVVSDGNREAMERDVAALHHYGLQATLEQAGS